MSVVGDVIDVTCNHPTLGAANFFVKANEASTFNLGGFVSDDDDDMVDSGGNMIDKMTRKRPSFSVVLTNDMNTRQDLEKIAAYAASPVLGDWTVTHINGKVYGVKGKPVGDIMANGDTGNINLKVAGGGAMKQIA